MAIDFHHATGYYSILETEWRTCGAKLCKTENFDCNSNSTECGPPDRSYPVEPYPWLLQFGFFLIQFFLSAGPDPKDDGLLRDQCALTSQGSSCRAPDTRPHLKPSPCANGNPQICSSTATNRSESRSAAKNIVMFNDILGCIWSHGLLQANEDINLTVSRQLLYLHEDHKFKRP